MLRRFLICLILVQAVVLLFLAPLYAQEAQTIGEVRQNSARSLMEFIPVDADNRVFSSALMSTYEKNPTMKAARAQTRGVFEKLPQADAGWRPVIGAEAGVNYSDVDTEFGNSILSSLDPDGSGTAKDAALVLAQPLYRGGSTRANIKSAKNAIWASISLLEQTEQRVLLEGAISYLDVLRDEIILKLRLNNRDVLQEQYSATDKRFRAGELTQTDVAQAESRLARADAEVISAQGNLKSSRARFEQVIGYPPVHLAFPSFIIRLPGTLDEALSYADKENPGVRAAQYAQESAKHDIDSVYGELLPSISLQGRMQKGYDPSTGIDERDVNSIGVIASMPLYEAGAVRSRVREAKHFANQRLEEIFETKNNTREEVVSAWENLAAAAAEKKARLSQVEASDVARFGVKREADYGARTTLDVLDADQELLEAKVAFITAQRNEFVARCVLATAMGIFNPENLGFGEKVSNYNAEVMAVRKNLFSTGVFHAGVNSEKGVLTNNVLE